MASTISTRAGVRSRGVRQILVFVCVLTTLAGCDPQPEDSLRTETEALAPRASQPAASEPLTGLASDHGSAEALSRAVLKALEEKDEVELTQLRVTYREYSELLFPHFDAAKPPRNIPVEFHWKMLDTKSIVGAREALEGYGGQEFELLESCRRASTSIPRSSCYARCGSSCAAFPMVRSTR